MQVTLFQWADTASSIILINQAIVFAYWTFGFNDIYHFFEIMFLLSIIPLHDRFGYKILNKFRYYHCGCYCLFSSYCSLFYVNYLKALGDIEMRSINIYTIESSLKYKSINLKISAKVESLMQIKSRLPIMTYH